MLKREGPALCGWVDGIKGSYRLAAPPRLYADTTGNREYSSMGGVLFYREKGTLL